MTKKSNPPRSPHTADILLAGASMLCVLVGVVLASGSGAPRAPGIEGAVYFPALLGACVGAGAFLISRILRLALGRRHDDDDDINSR